MNGFCPRSRCSRFLFFAAALLAVAAIFPLRSAVAATPEITIGIVSDGEWARHGLRAELVTREVSALLSGEYVVRFPASSRLQGNWTKSSVAGAADRLLADPRVDIILALGVIASDELATRRSLSKPVIAPVIVDADIQGLPRNGAASGVHNLNYLFAFRDMEREMRRLVDLTGATRVALISDRGVREAIPELDDKLVQLARRSGVVIVPVPAVDSAAEVLAALPADVDAVYVTPLSRFTDAEFTRLAQGLIDRHLPSFSYFGRGEVVQGLLASLAPEADATRIARRIALNVQRIALGEDAGDIEVVFDVGSRLSLNMETARAIGFSPSWDVLSEAELINEEETPPQRTLSLSAVVDAAMRANLDLAAAARGVEAGRQAVREARAELLPQLGANTRHTRIDADRASSGGGLFPQRVTAGSLSITQSLYSDRAWTAFEVQRRLQESTLEEQEALRLDVVQQAATAYLDVLRSATLERIQRRNLAVTRTNLELARSRERIGYSGPADVYRWESELGSNRQDVFAAQAAHRQSIIALNRILDRPLEERFVTQETGLGDPVLLVSDPRFLRYVDNPRSWTLFREFMVVEGMSASPELRGIDALLSARERAVRSAQRSFWLPEFALRAEISETFDRGGAGAGPIPGRDDTDWTLTAQASLPLYAGGARDATLARTREELAQVRLERRATADRIEQRIRSAAHQTGASYASIQAARGAAAAAASNLELVTDAYGRGVTSVVELIDAQTAALSAEEAASNAVYRFLVDMIELQRASARFDFFLDAQQREAWFARIEEFYRAAGVPDTANRPGEAK